MDPLSPSQHEITLMSSTSSVPKLNVWAYVNIFPLAGWIAALAMTMALAFCFSVSSDGSVGQGITLMGRLFLQLRGLHMSDILKLWHFLGTNTAITQIF